MMKLLCIIGTFFVTKIYAQDTLFLYKTNQVENKMLITIALLNKNKAFVEFKLLNDRSIVGVFQEECTWQLPKKTIYPTLRVKVHPIYLTITFIKKSAFKFNDNLAKNAKIFDHFTFAIDTSKQQVWLWGCKFEKQKL